MKKEEIEEEEMKNGRNKKMIKHWRQCFMLGLQKTKC